MRKSVSAVLIMAAAVLGAAPQAPDRRVLTEQAKLLDQELALAKTNKSYLYVDLSARRVELRIQGLVLKTWAVAGFSQWGRPLPGGSFKLRKKEALRTPERKNITPGAEKERSEKPKSGELEVLEVKDMPGHFNLGCEGGITLRFRASSGKLPIKMKNFIGSLARSIYLPVRTLLAAVRKADFTDVQIVLTSETDVQSLYWTAEEGMNVLVVHK
jgi:hypothetical protein